MDTGCSGTIEVMLFGVEVLVMPDELVWDEFVTEEFVVVLF